MIIAPAINGIKRGTTALKYFTQLIGLGNFFAIQKAIVNARKITATALIALEPTEDAQNNPARKRFLLSKDESCPKVDREK